MRHDPFFKTKSRPDPDAVVKSRPAPGRDAEKTYKVRGAPETARPPGPRVVEVDGDQDSLARTSESDTPTDSFRPGLTTDAPEEGGDMVRPVGAVKATSAIDEHVGAVPQSWRPSGKKGGKEKSGPRVAG